MEVEEPGEEPIGGAERLSELLKYKTRQQQTNKKRERERKKEEDEIDIELDPTLLS